MENIKYYIFEVEYFYEYDDDFGYHDCGIYYRTLYIPAHSLCEAKEYLKKKFDRDDKVLSYEYKREATEEEIQNSIPTTI